MNKNVFVLLHFGKLKAKICRETRKDMIKCACCWYAIIMHVLYQFFCEIPVEICRDSQEKEQLLQFKTFLNHKHSPFRLIVVY